MSGCATDTRMNFLFVHEHLGAMGGAETDIQLTAEELQSRGHHISLLYRTPTGRNEALWRKTFDQCLQLPELNSREAVKDIINLARPDLIFLHKFKDSEVVEALFQNKIPVVRRIHDHGMYCLREYKYNPLTRAICTRPASGYCVFPCLATVSRRRGGLLAVKWSSFRWL